MSLKIDKNYSLLKNKRTRNLLLIKKEIGFPFSLKLMRNRDKWWRPNLQENVYTVLHLQNKITDQNSFRSEPQMPITISLLIILTFLSSLSLIKNLNRWIKIKVSLGTIQLMNLDKTNPDGNNYMKDINIW